ncbi:conserved TM helix family protein [Acinetobacter baumannii 44327_8]|uniref:Small-conductance mechanosensitive channel n=1 Tax=Acinetobacter baumannii 1462234 TaxID=1310646 RepID=A0A9P3CWK5_ACIBA|nr:mechanosensitive ion channel [Acinetobacter baumannii]EXB12157.1 conserved TM helix family protein [Acinetobacter baumannii 1397084]EXC94930.1 conserved TM helix family protein [Acinetobacter baumannii 1051830]EXD25527.1 conserved TM helix family protein [Acinetobacter baumannii 34654]EYD12294.1 conserved TM helix family protein [Acinetobacter baumannii 44362_2]KCW28928.1 conserved TM helix family protein [Acinetobacter baumannii 6935]KCY94509.1 conserved TM helix family protein [Acinetoba
MNEFFNGPRGAQFDAMYYWDQFHPILAAIVILLVGWIIALLVAAGVKKLLQKVNTNAKLSSATGRTPNIEGLISKVVFWFILILAVVAALNVLNISGVSGPFSNMVNQVLVYIPNIIAAVVVGFIGWIVARLVRAGGTNVLSRTQLDDKLSSEVGVGGISQNIGEILYWLVLLLFLPIVLSILGLTGLLIPVQNMVNDAVAFLPNIFIAGVIVFVGYILAKIVRGIVEGLINSLGVQSQAEKIGLFKNSNVGKFLGSFVFAIIIITTLIVAFEALGIETISQPATAMLNEILQAIPNIIAAGLILLVAYIVSRFVGRLVAELIAGTGVDEIPAKLDVQRFLGQTKVSNAVGWLIVFFTMLFAVSEAADRLGFDQISGLIAMFIHFGANILLGAVILVIGFWLANVVANVVQRGEYNSSRWLGSLVRVLIIGLVLALGLRAMGIADSIVNLAFGLTLGAVAVAFALAFGLGGRQPAERLLSDLLDKAKKEASQPNPLYQPPTNNKTTGSSTTVSTPSTTTTAPSTTVSSDAKPADSAQVNPSQPPVNKPFGSTGENDEI